MDLKLLHAYGVLILSDLFVVCDTGMLFGMISKKWHFWHAEYSMGVEISAGREYSVEMRRLEMCTLSDNVFKD